MISFSSGEERLKTFDTVRVRVLLNPIEVRLIHSSRGRVPSVGDEATIVDEPEQDVFTVECVGPDGVALWLAELSRDELELVKQA